MSDIQDMQSEGTKGTTPLYERPRVKDLGNIHEMKEIQGMQFEYIDKLKAALVAIKDKCAGTMEIDMGSYESVPVGFTRSIYEMAHAVLLGMEVSDD